MITKICFGASVALILLMTGCTSAQYAQWRSMSPPPPSGNYASG
jgi:hypothetical protein